MELFQSDPGTVSRLTVSSFFVREFLFNLNSLPRRELSRDILPTNISFPLSLLTIYSSSLSLYFLKKRRRRKSLTLKPSTTSLFLPSPATLGCRRPPEHHLRPEQPAVQAVTPSWCRAHPPMAPSLLFVMETCCCW